jgi:hypothetical protein
MAHLILQTPSIPGKTAQRVHTPNFILYTVLTFVSLVLNHTELKHCGFYFNDEQG